MESSVPALFLLLGLLPAAAGVAMIFSGVCRLLRERHLVRTGRQVTATVVDNRITSHDEGRQSFEPVVEFFTTDEQLVRAVVPSSSHSSHVVGTRMAVVHDPRDPSRVAAGSSAAPVTAIAFGLGFLAFSLLWLKLLL
jgi:hypothetical protein